jgi:hypothetical protein
MRAQHAPPTPAPLFLKQIAICPLVICAGAVCLRCVSGAWQKLINSQSAKQIVICERAASPTHTYDFLFFVLVFVSANKILSDASSLHNLKLKFPHFPYNLWQSNFWSVHFSSACMKKAMSEK